MERKTRKELHRRGETVQATPANYPRRLRLGDPPGTYGKHEASTLPCDASFELVQSQLQYRKLK